MSADDDDQLQRAVLDRLLDLSQATVEELIRDLTAGSSESTDFGRRDRVERATRDLVRTGLANRVGDLVTPSRAARRFFELWDG